MSRVVEAPIERRATYDALDAYADGDEDGVFAITASSGIGKTTVLAKWIARRPERPLARFIGASDGSTSIDGLLASIVREATGADPAEPATLRDTWTRQVSGVVVLDALDQVDTGLDDLDWLPWTLPPGLKVIVSYATDAPAGAQLRDRMEAGEPVVHRLEPFDDLEQRRAIVADYLSGYLKELDAELLEVLIGTPSAGNPLYLKVVLSELRVFGSYAALDGQLRTRFGDDPQSAFAELLRRLETDPAYTPVPSGDIVPLLFGLLTHARAGLAAGEVAAIAAARLSLGDAVDAEDAINLVLRQVRTFTARRLGHYDFLHSSFRAAAQARYSGEDWHGLLADYFDGLPLDSRRRLAELPYRLTAAGRDERARDVLSDLRFVDAKCAAGMTSELIADYEAARPLDPLPVFARFARTESHNLARYATTPGFTVQQRPTRRPRARSARPACGCRARAGWSCSIRRRRSAGRCRRRSRAWPTGRPTQRSSPPRARFWQPAATAPR